MSFGFDLTTPNLTLSDQTNIQNVTTLGFQLNNPVNVEWFLYSEGNWPSWKEGLVSANYTQYASGYDGYAFFVGMQFDAIQTAGDSIGLEIGLPNSDAGDTTGLGWQLNDDGLTYSGLSYYWDNTVEDFYLDLTWVCAAVPVDDTLLTIQGYCYNFMPSKSGPYSDYRFSPKDQVDFYGWTYFA